MRSLIRKALWVTVAAALLLLLSQVPAVYRSGGIVTRTVKTDKATAYVIVTLRNVLNPHSDAKSELLIGNRRFSDLRGEPPFYIDMKRSSSIVFVTHHVSYPRSATLHVFNLETGTDIAVDIDGSAFGWNIGSRREAGENLSDSVVELEEDRIAVSTRAINWESTAVINLKTGRVEEERTSFFDETGQVTNRSVREEHN